MFILFNERGICLDRNRPKDWEGIQFHYDLPAEFFRHFLDEGMHYTCAYFQHQEEPLNQAQKNRLAPICRIDFIKSKAQ